MPKALEITAPSMTGIATYPPGATYGPRIMRDFEFVWLIEGDAEYRWDEQTVAAPEGSIVLCRPGATDFFQWDQKRRTRHGYFHFDINSVPDDWPEKQQWTLVRGTSQGDVMSALFRHLLSQSAGDAGLRMLSMKLMLTVFVLGQHDAVDVPRDALPAPVEAAQSFIHTTLDKNPATPIELNDLANAALVSREHLCRLFVSSTGRSPVETVRLARLDRVAVLLTRSNYSIKEIAEICGFSSPFHLSRAIRAAFGRSPKELRKRIREGEIPPMSLLLKRG